MDLVCGGGNKKPRSVCSGVAEVEPSTDPVHPVVTTTLRAHSLRDANRDRQDDGGGERLHRGKSMNRGHCNITCGPVPVNRARAKAANTANTANTAKAANTAKGRRSTMPLALTTMT